MSNTNIIGVISPGLEVNVEIIGSGPRGVQGDSPVKGVDYFTAEDINEFLSHVVNDKEFIYNQIQASATWSITHNLNKFPSVAIVDTGNNVVIGEIHYIDENNLIVSFSSEFSGKAYLN